MRPKDAWLAAQGQLELQMNRNAYNTWVRDCKFVSFADGVYTLGVKSNYVRAWLEEKLYRAIKFSLSSIYNEQVDVCFIIVDEAEMAAKGLAIDGTPLPVRDIPNPFANSPTEFLPHDDEDLATSVSRIPNDWQSKLRATYTFDTFVVGTSNQMARAAADAVTNAPGTAYNPLYIYGDTGLGKTHLLNAIGNACADNGLKVLYVNAEEFTNDLIESIRGKSMSAFRDLYRHVDVLLIDDIQFMIGKESTQEEFFHTFNALHDNQLQIVVTADRKPSEMKGLDKRIASRMEWGLVVDVQLPTYETRLAIVRDKAEINGHYLAEGVAEYLAGREIESIRELEGLVNQVTARATLLKTQMTLAVVEQLFDGSSLQRDIRSIERRLTVDQVIERAAAVMQADLRELLSESRNRQISQARQWVVYLAREATSASWPEIGQALGGRNHSTVLRSYKQIAKQIDADPAMRRQAEDMRRKVLQFVG